MTQWDSSTCDGSMVGSTPAHFTDQERDAETGFDHFMYRQYANNVARWTSPDPAGMGAVDPTNPQTCNRYGYVGNRPSDATDPLGLCPPEGSNKYCTTAYSGTRVVPGGWPQSSCGVNPFCVAGPFNGNPNCIGSECVTGGHGQSSGSTALAINLGATADAGGGSVRATIVYGWGCAFAADKWKNIVGGCTWGAIGTTLNMRNPVSQNSNDPGAYFQAYSEAERQIQKIVAVRNASDYIYQLSNQVTWYWDHPITPCEGMSAVGDTKGFLETWTPIEIPWSKGIDRFLAVAGVFMGCNSN